jgi:hypothetical protein
MIALMTRLAGRQDRNLEHVIGARDRTRFLALLKKIAAQIG